MQKHLPSNVAWFERLMYLSLGIGVITSALRWSELVALGGPLGGANAMIFVLAFVFAFMALFIWLVARRHKNWARWFLLILGLLGLPSYFRTLGEVLQVNPVAGTLSLLQILAQVVAFFLIFTGDARDWFEQPSATTPET